MKERERSGTKSKLRKRIPNGLENVFIYPSPGIMNGIKHKRHSLYPTVPEPAVIFYEKCSRTGTSSIRLFENRRHNLRKCVARTGPIILEKRLAKAYISLIVEAV